MHLIYTVYPVNTNLIRRWFIYILNSIIAEYLTVPESQSVQCIFKAAEIPDAVKGWYDTISLQTHKMTSADDSVCTQIYKYLVQRAAL